jgi:hypothetical protein
MKTIWKYKLDLTDVQEVIMPKGAKVLSVQIKDGVPCLWALGETESDKEPRRFAIVGTGNRCWCSDWEYVGTFQDDPFVWHVFQAVKDTTEEART